MSQKCGYKSIPNFLVVIFVAADGRIHSSTTSEYVPSGRKLADGQRYFVYHVRIYNDRFFPIQTKESIHDCYIILLRISTRERTLHGRIRSLWVKPRGASSRDVMCSMIEDVQKNRRGNWGQSRAWWCKYFLGYCWIRLWLPSRYLKYWCHWP